MSEFMPTALDSFFDHAQEPTHSATQTTATNPVQPTANNSNIISQEVANQEVANQEANSDSQENGFANLGLSQVLLRSIAKTGYTTPTPIQAQAIPAAMNGKDLLLSAQTGSGKTAAFVLPMLHRLSEQKPTKGYKKVQALILTPTRELAHQVQDSIRKYGSSMKDLFSVPLVGGSAYSGQIRALKKGVQIIVATPGRLLDHINAGRVDLSQLELLILDEADRMLDMGFADDIEAILNATPASRQTIMSSATWDGPVGKIAESFTTNPERISIKVETAHIDEKVYFCDNFDHKNKLLESLICDPERGQAIIFTATKRSSEEVAERLQEWGHKACYLHGDLPQSKRNRIVADLRSGKYDIVVATDVAARGIDLPNITHVFNYDLPRQVEDYVHRIGRSGRAGRTGTAVNLCSRDDRRQFGNISRYLKRDIQESTVEGLEPRFVEKFDSRGKGGRDGKNRGGGRGRGGERFADNRYTDKNSDRYGDRNSDRRSSNRFESRSDSRFDNRSDSRFDNRSDSRTDNRFDDSRSRSNRFDDKPRRRDEFGSSSNDNRFERSAKSWDKPKFGQERGSRFDNRSDRRSENRFEQSDRPRKPRMTEESFGQKPRHSSRDNYQGKSEFQKDGFKKDGFKSDFRKEGFKQDGFKKSEGRSGDFNRRSHGSYSKGQSFERQDGFAAPKRQRKDGDFKGDKAKQHSRDGFQRRNSSGKPL